MPRLRAAGCPIRTPADQRPFAPPRRLSRPAASFLASGSQGILRTPSLASRSSEWAPSLAAGPSLFSRLSYSCVCFPSILSKNRRGRLGARLVENVGLEPTTPGLQSRCSSQLSQSPNCLCVVPGRLELPTPTLSVWCSNRLSYGTPSGVPGTRPSPSRLPVSLSGQHRGTPPGFQLIIEN